jgi:phenylacetate-CoA ligase
LKKLEEFNPDILWVYPTSGDALARYLLESGKTLPGVKVLFSSSEMLAPNSWPRWQQAFPQAIVLDYYSQAERVCLSYQRTADTAWFVPAYGYVELLPDAITLETPENLRSARVIATGFWNPAMPLVRYETGDRILYPRSYTDADLEAVALGDKPFTRVLGRLSEYLITPQGGQIQAINNIPYEVEHLERVQFIQSSPSSVEIRCAVLPGFSALDAEKLLVNARKKIPATIDVRIVTDKPLEKMTNGKTPFVIRQC